MSYDLMDLAYLAGIIDGEGTIGITVSKPYKDRISPSFKVYVSVTMTDPNIPYLIYGIFGGSVNNYPSRHEHHKPTTIWRSSCSTAVLVCKTLHPYLRLKKQQAEMAIDFDQLPRKAGRALTPEQIAERYEYVEAIQLLNRRGI